MNKIYISGKITGTTDYMQRFSEAKLRLMNYFDCDIINPAKVNSMLPTNTTYEEYMKMSLCMLSMCDTIYMLKGWKDSKGARLEHEYAKAHNYNIIYESEEE